MRFAQIEVEGDGMRKFKINITKNDILQYRKEKDNLTSNALTNCACAKAIKRNKILAPLLKSVGICYINFERISVRLSADVSNTISNACQLNGKVIPIKFTIEVPDNVL